MPINVFFDFLYSPGCIAPRIKSSETALSTTFTRKDIHGLTDKTTLQPV